MLNWNEGLPVFEYKIFRCGAGDYYGDEVLESDRTHSDRRLGYHEEAQCVMFDSRGIKHKLLMLETN